MWVATDRGGGFGKKGNDRDGGTHRNTQPKIGVETTNFFSPKLHIHEEIRTSQSPVKG